MTTTITDNDLEAVQMIAASLALEGLTKPGQINDVICDTLTIGPPHLIYPALSALWGMTAAKLAPPQWRHESGTIKIPARMGGTISPRTITAEDVVRPDPVIAERSTRTDRQMAGLPAQGNAFITALAIGDYRQASRIMTEVVTDLSALQGWMLMLAASASVSLSDGRCPVHAKDDPQFFGGVFGPPDVIDRNDLDFYVARISEAAAADVHDAARRISDRLTTARAENGFALTCAVILDQGTRLLQIEPDIPAFLADARQPGHPADIRQRIDVADRLARDYVSVYRYGGYLRATERFIEIAQDDADKTAQMAASLLVAAVFVVRAIAAADLDGVINTACFLPTAALDGATVEDLIIRTANHPLWS